MLQRCTNPKHRRYPDWGGRGIKVCARWMLFSNFLVDMGAKPEGTTLDRWPDNDGDYEPGNCRWATPKEQVLNRRNTVVVDVAGKSVCLKDACRMLGLNYQTVFVRMQRHKISAQEALR